MSKVTLYTNTSVGNREGAQCKLCQSGKLPHQPIKSSGPLGTSGDAQYYSHPCASMPALSDSGMTRQTEQFPSDLPPPKKKNLHLSHFFSWFLTFSRFPPIFHAFAKLPQVAKSLETMEPWSRVSGYQHTADKTRAVHNSEVVHSPIQIKRTQSAKQRLEGV